MKKVSEVEGYNGYECSENSVTSSITSVFWGNSNITVDLKEVSCLVYYRYLRVFECTLKKCSTFLESKCLPFQKPIKNFDFLYAFRLFK